MSIDPLKYLSPLQLSSSPSQAEKKLPRTDGRFADLLNSLESLPNSSADPAAKASSLVHLAQLQLFHGLLGLIDDSTSETLLPSFELPGAVPQQPSVKSQKLDNLYARLQPTLLEPASPPQRSDIERLIDKVAEKVSLAPELIRSVVATESNFDPRAVSPVGAQGLMQLMPATAEELGVEDSFDPQQNLLGGSRYLKQLLEKYEGDLDRALAAYNWGQGNVDRKGLERMPEETRNYLVKVKARLAEQSG